MKTSSTKNRRALLDWLGAHPTESFTTEQLCDALLEDGHGKSSLYRLVSRLTEEGTIVGQSDPLTGRVRYRAQGSECTSHLHLQCTGCGKVIHLDHDLSGALYNQILNFADFTLDESRTLLFGVCRVCKGASHA